MKIIYYDSEDQTIEGPSIFLAGPTHRKEHRTEWRLDTVQIFEKLEFNGTLCIPEFASMNSKHEFKKKADQDGDLSAYSEIIDWERDFLNKATYILFWIPRDLKILPGFTTNFELGEHFKDRRTYAGAPANSEKNRYLKYRYNQQWKNQKEWQESLEDLISSIVVKLNAS